MIAEIGLAEVVENGVTFATGLPVTFEFMRRNEPAPDMGSLYGQDIEPAGRYLLHDAHGSCQVPLHNANGEVVDGWEFGSVSFQNPLVIELSTEYNSGGFSKNVYGPQGWKQRLTDIYGETGIELSRELIQQGFDGIITVSPYDTREIVDLTVIE